MTRPEAFRQKGLLIIVRALAKLLTKYIEEIEGGLPFPEKNLLFLYL